MFEHDLPETAGTAPLPAAASIAFDVALTLLQVALDPKATQQRLVAIRNAIATAETATAKADAAKAALSQRTAEFERREAKISSGEVEIFQDKQTLKDERDALFEHERELKVREDQVVRHILRERGILHDYSAYTR